MNDLKQVIVNITSTSDEEKDALDVVTKIENLILLE